MTIERIIAELVDGSRTRHGALKYWEPSPEPEQEKALVYLEQDRPIIVWSHDWRTWRWPGKPFTVRFRERKLAHVFYVIDYQIQQADLAECLTSTIPYIRQCKKWFHENTK